MTDDQKTDASTGKSPWDDLKRMADEARVKLHLAGMEAKEVLKALEPKIQEMQTRLEAKGEKAADTVQEQLISVVDSVRRFVDELRVDVEVNKKAGATAEAAPPAAEAAPPAAESPDKSS